MYALAILFFIKNNAWESMQKEVVKCFFLLWQQTAVLTTTHSAPGRKSEREKLNHILCQLWRCKFSICLANCTVKNYNSLIFLQYKIVVRSNWNEHVKIRFCTWHNVPHNIWIILYFLVKYKMQFALLKARKIYWHVKLNNETLILIWSFVEFWLSVRKINLNFQKNCSLKSIIVFDFPA